MTSDAGGGVLKVSELPLPPEGVASSGISYDAHNLHNAFDEFAHRHGRDQLLGVLLEAGRRHHLLIIAGPERPLTKDAAYISGDGV